MCEKIIEKLKREYWETLVASARKQTELQNKHIEDYRSLLVKYRLFDSQFEFPDEKTKIAFDAEFAELGHTDYISRRCKCRKLTRE